MADTEKPPSEPSTDETLETFKADPESADNETMDDGIHARPRMNWNPITDVGGSEAAPGEAPPEKSAFQFDLGGALARLGDPDPPAIADPAPEPELTEPVRVEPEVTVDSRPAPPLDRRQTRRTEPVAPEDDPLSSVRGLLADEREARTRSSVFADETPITEARVAPTQPIEPTPPAPVAPAPVAPAPVAPAPVAPEPVAPAPVAPAPVAPAPVAPAPVAPEPVAPAPVAPAPVAPEPVAPAPVAPAPQPVPANDATTPIIEPAPAPPAEPISQPADPPSAPVLPSNPVIPGDTAGLPTLPVAVPSAPPAVVAPIESAPSTPDVHALRSAQLRAAKQQRQGKMFGHAVIGFMSIAGLIAGGLLFGRAYLFPTEWDASLTPIVDEIQEVRGADFDHTVSLVVQPADEYAATVLAASIGSGWTASLPEWRAAGLAAGNATVESVTASVAAQIPVVYDADSDTIYQSADSDLASVVDDLRVALNQVYDSQVGDAPAREAATNGFTGVSSPQFLAERAVDAFLVGRSEAVSAEVAIAADLPLPIAYELAAIDYLGEAILVGANVDPASVSLGEPYPEAIAQSLDDAPARTASGLVQPGEQPLADAVALGVDDWSLVWGARLPTTTVDAMVELVTGDSYRPIDRAGTTCFVGVFQTATEADGVSLFNTMLRWAGDAPVGSQAVATRLSTQRVQIEACDPGSADATAPDAGAVDALIARQIARLAR